MIPFAKNTSGILGENIGPLYPYKKKISTPTLLDMMKSMMGGAATATNPMAAMVGVRDWILFVIPLFPH